MSGGSAVAHGVTVKIKLTLVLPILLMAFLAFLFDESTDFGVGKLGAS